TEGVHSARANPRTGNILVHYDPHTTSSEALLAILRTVGPGWPGKAATPLANPPRAAVKEPVFLNPPRPVGLAGFLADLLRTVCGDWTSGIRGFTWALNLIDWLQDSPRLHRNLTGHHGPGWAELFCKLTRILSSALSATVFTLAAACLRAFFQFV